MSCYGRLTEAPREDRDPGSLGCSSGGNAAPFGSGVGRIVENDDVDEMRAARLDGPFS